MLLAVSTNEPNTVGPTISDVMIFRLGARLRTRELFSPSATASSRVNVGAEGEQHHDHQ